MFSAVGFSITLNLPSPIVALILMVLTWQNENKGAAVDNTLMNEQFVAM